MATVIKEHRLQDTQKRALLKYVIFPDANTVSNTVLVNVQSLFASLNVNNKILGAGTDPKSQYRTYIKRIFGMSKANGYLTLAWQGSGSNSNSEIITVGTGWYDFILDAEGAPGSAVFNNPAENSANTNGNIVFSTVNPSSSDAYTIVIDLRKNGADYDQGQTADPVAFNRGPANGFG